ncbi:hypothetical protein ACJMK2_004843 [Sinanodonta woodiana]|uniref:G-protein coupled receptors family 1 profile domain-containing protein n=1 Tax=Sinanodonta woodiana TaxID=1069815 RepID=A0ABD3VRB1_SINWO
MAEFSSANSIIVQGPDKPITKDVTTSHSLLRASTLEGNINNTDVSITNKDLDASLMSALMPLTIFIAVEASVGLVGNTLILYIYLCKYSKSNFRYFVLFLACIDLTSCLTTLPAEIYVQINWYTLEHEWICKLKSYFNVFTTWGSGEILFLIALDRYRKVCRPLGSQIPVSLARKSGFCALLIASIAALPIAFLWGKQTYTMHYKGSKIEVSICEKSDQYEHTIYPLIYIIITYSVPLGVLMLAAATFNVLVVRKVFCNLQPVQNIKETYYMSYNNTKDETGTCMRSRFNSLLIEKEESSGTHESGTDEATISTISGNTIIETFEEYSELYSYRNIISAIESKDIYQIANIEMRENFKKRSNSFSNNCNTIFGCGVKKQAASNQVCFKNNTLLQKEQKTTCRANNFLRKRAAGPQKAIRKSLTSSLGNVSSSSVSVMNDTSVFSRVRRKTMIMLILTSVFVVTTILYVILLSLVADEGTFLQNLSDTQKVFFFFFLRLYFINSVINPILYGILDPRFRQGLKSLMCTYVQTE